MGLGILSTRTTTFTSSHSGLTGADSELAAFCSFGSYSRQSRCIRPPKGISSVVQRSQNTTYRVYESEMDRPNHTFLVTHPVHAGRVKNWRGGS